jgi:hypothetical protein
MGKRSEPELELEPEPHKSNSASQHWSTRTLRYEYLSMQNIIIVVKFTNAVNMLVCYFLYLISRTIRGGMEGKWYQIG